ncbi:MAG: YdeI/OmpD-associated family protein [Polyangiaceae bacterium]
MRAFEGEAALEKWFERNHQSAQQLFIRIYKKDSGKKSVTYSGALDVALCWGWIDGVKKPYDAESFLQRFTPRKPKSRWSQLNRERVGRLIAAKRMTAHGMKEIDAAKADGRWQAAYASARNIEMPADLLSAIRAEPKALRTFESLSKVNLYALAYRTHSMKTEAGRKKRIADFVEKLKRGQTPHPNTKASAAKRSK